MIKLLGVIAEGGVPIVIKTFVELKREELLPSLIEALKALSMVIGTGEIRRLDFRQDKLLVVESRKKYTVVALVDVAEDYVERLLGIIAEDIDRSNIPIFLGVVDETLVGSVHAIIDKYLSSTLTISITDTLIELWDPIFSHAKELETINRAIQNIDSQIEQADILAEKKWNDFASRVQKDKKKALSYALAGDFSHACASSLDFPEEHWRIFCIKMGLLANSIFRVPSPPLALLEKIGKKLNKNNIYAKLVMDEIKLRQQKISLMDYISTFGAAIKQFMEKKDLQYRVLSFIFIDPTLRFFPNFARKIAESFKDKSRVIYTFISSILERDNILKKAYSITKPHEFRDELSFWNKKIKLILVEFRKILSPSFLHKILGKVPRGAEANEIILRCLLNIETYLMLLTILSQSPIMDINERRKRLRDIIRIYSRYVRPAIDKKLPIFCSTLMNIFQSLGISIAEIYGTFTYKAKIQNLEKIKTLFNDVITIIAEEPTKFKAYLPFITTMTSSLSPTLTMIDKFLSEEIVLLYMALRMIDIMAVESWKIVIPYNFAAFTVNLLNTLAALSLKVLKPDLRDSHLIKTLDCIVDVYKWLLSQGKVSRDMITSLSFFAQKIAKKYKKIEDLLDFLIALSKIAILDWNKQDYDVALISENFIGLLLKSYKLKHDARYLELAKKIYRISLNAWGKYGFKKKRVELYTKYEKVLGQ